MGWINAFPNLFEPKRFHGSYSSGNSSGSSSPSLNFNRAVCERLCIEEVGVDLELCVHAHGHDVDPIMEASCNKNYFLDIISSGICELVLCNRGFDHIVLLWSHFSDKMKYLSSVDLFTCPTSIMFYLRVLPLGISRISRNYITSYGFFINCYFSPIPIFLGPGLSTENTK